MAHPSEEGNREANQEEDHDSGGDQTCDRIQPGILSAPLPVGRSLTFRFAPDVDPRPALARLRDAFRPEDGVVGLGPSLVRATGHEIAGLRAFPALAGPGIAAPSTQQALWIFLRGAHRSATFDATERVTACLHGGLVLDDAMDTFVYRDSRDLSGFEDGTENPREAAAVAAAIVSGGGGGLAGSSFVAVQRWVHDLAMFRGFPSERRDLIVGRRADTNAEIADAPESAHVKRTAQESFSPAAFMVRRSMPWATAREQGLEFIAYGESLDWFERMLIRMMALEDGVADALFTFSRPVTGGYYWCPPLAHGRLNLSYLGL